MFKNTKYYLILAILITSCAVIQDPSGGPKDTVPPEVKSFSVNNLTTNFKEEELVIEFTKYMTNNKVNDNLFISPNIKTKNKWNGKKLRIIFEEPFLENTTYSVQLGTDYTDWKNNMPTQSYNIVFSTGSVIDTGKISGEVVGDEKILQGAYLYLYKLNTDSQDTLNPTHTKPNYKTQLGSSGKFDIYALKDGKYRAFAVKDVYKDDIIDLGLDNFGAAIDDITVSDGMSAPIRISIGPPADKSGPKLYSAKSIDDITTELNFDEAIKFDSFKESDIRLSAINTLNYQEFSAVFQDYNNPAKLVLINDSTLDTAFQWGINVTNITDTLGNPIGDTLNSAIFYVNENDYPDPMIIDLPFKDSTVLTKPTDVFKIGFNTALSDSTFNAIFSIKTENDSIVPFISAFRFPDNVINIAGIRKLEHNNWYKLIFNTKALNFYYPNKIKDTSYVLRFKTYDKRNFSKVSGSIKPEKLCENIFIEFRRGNDLIKVFPDESGKWSIEEMAEGKYEVTLVCDSNKNGRFDYGFPFPMEYSEKFYILKNAILVRAGWDIEDLILRFE